LAENYFPILIIP